MQHTSAARRSQFSDLYTGLPRRVNALLRLLHSRSAFRWWTTTTAAVTQYLAALVLIMTLGQTSWITVTGGVAEVKVLHTCAPTTHRSGGGLNWSVSRSRARTK